MENISIHWNNLLRVSGEVTSPTLIDEFSQLVKSSTGAQLIEILDNRDNAIALIVHPKFEMLSVPIINRIGEEDFEKRILDAAVDDIAEALTNKSFQADIGPDDIDLYVVAVLKKFDPDFVGKMLIAPTLQGGKRDDNYPLFRVVAESEQPRTMLPLFEQRVTRPVMFEISKSVARKINGPESSRSRRSGENFEVAGQ